MKKFLLSALCFAGVASVAFAENVTLNANDATNIDGTHFEEVPTIKDEEGKITQHGYAEHYQPLNSLEINGYKFTFEQGGSNNAPAYYFATSTNEDQQKTIRVYGGEDASEGNTMTITAPEGVTFGQINFTCKSGTNDAVVNASVGKVSGVTTTEMVWKNETPINTVTLTFTIKTRFAEMVILPEAEKEEELPDPITDSTFAKATSLENGKYIFVVDGKIAAPLKASYSYGFMYLNETANFVGDNIVTSADNALNVTVADGKASLVDYLGRNYGQKGTYASFQMYETFNEDCEWSYEFVGETIKLTHVVRPEFFVCQYGTYTSVAPANSPTEYVLPTIYKLVENSAVEAIEADVDANAPVVYYNLQGQRVANPENGLYIRVQGNKVAKVIL